jgi:hypothetical protein
MNQWEVLVSHRDQVLHRSEGTMKQDELKTLLGDKGAQVELEVSTTEQVGERWLKVRCSVRLTCNQDAASLERAAELALSKSLEYSKDALNLLNPKQAGSTPALKGKF